MTSLVTPSVNVVDLLDQQKLSRFQILIATLCAIVVAVDGFDAQAIGYVAPTLSKAWSLPPGKLGPIFGAGVFGMMIGALLFGPLADRFGRKHIIIASLLAFGACSLLTVTADSLTSLFVWRLLTGIGLGGAYPNAIALTCDYSPRRNRATLIMVMFIGFGLGSAIGGAVTAELTAKYGWPTVFWIGAIVPLALAPVLLALLPESIAYLALKGTEDSRVMTLLKRINPALNFNTGVRFVADGARTRGLPMQQLFHERRAMGTLMLWVMFCAGLFQIYFLSNWLPTVTHEAGIAVEKAVLITAGMQIAIAISTVLFGLLIDRFGAFRILPLTYLLAAVFVAAVGANGSSVPLVAITVFGAGFFVGGSQNAANALCATYYPTSIRSTGVSWGHGIGRIGSIAGALVGGVMFARKWPTQTIFLIAAVPMLCASLAAFVMGQLGKLEIGPQDGDSRNSDSAGVALVGGEGQ
jgi:MFS transporter, AAHS family, 4-hydroxybenzoate transporter